MTTYTTTSTFTGDAISTKRYTLIWRAIIERSENNHTKHIDNGKSNMV